MTDEEQEINDEASEKRSRSPRKRNETRRIFVNRMIGGKPKEQGSFPETTIGTPLERRLPTFLRDFFGEGEFRVEIRKPNGHFERSFDFTIAENEKQDVAGIDPEPDEFETDDLDFTADRQMNALEVENLLLKERLKRIDEDLARQKAGNQNETSMLIQALEDSRREQKEILMLFLAQQTQQSQQPKIDPTTQAMNILEKSLGIVTRAKAISEEIAPTETATDSSLLGGAAKLVDSLGRNAGTFLPLFGGLNLAQSRRTAAPPTQTAMSSNDYADQNINTSNLAEMFRQSQTDKETGNE